MSLSFKQFIEALDKDLSDEQINELFGMFATASDKQKALAKQKSDEFKARRAALQKKAMGQPADDEDEDDEEDAAPNKPGAKPAAKPGVRPGSNPAANIRSANAAARTGQVDWAMEGKLTEAAKRYADFDEWDENYSNDINSAFEVWMSANKKKQMFKLYQQGKNFKSKVFGDVKYEKDIKAKIAKWKQQIEAKGFTVFASDDNIDQIEYVYYK